MGLGIPIPIGFPLDSHGKWEKFWATNGNEKGNGNSSNGNGNSIFYR